jgi:hypothetical protein
MAWSETIAKNTAIGPPVATGRAQVGTLGREVVYILLLAPPSIRELCRP